MGAGSLAEFPPLPADLYLQESVDVAKSLLNCLLVRRVGENWLAGRISETEAYSQSEPSCHAYRGKTERNAAMFEVGGVAYIYFAYGMHHCLNAVTGREGVGDAVLIRAVEPLMGFEILQRNRRAKTALSEQVIAKLPVRERIKLGVSLCGGPGKLCQAFALTREQNGADLRIAENLWIAAPALERPITPQEIIAAPRIGITQATDLLWRFALKNDPYLSKRIDPT